MKGQRTSEPPSTPKENPVTWIPERFVHPAKVALGDGQYHLRPIRASDLELDMPAVMGSRERLWSIYGQAWGWPPAGMTAEQDRQDLARHEAEAERHEAFNYAVLDASESLLVGCVYIDPPEKAGADAEISWWVRDEFVDFRRRTRARQFRPRMDPARVATAATPVRRP